MVLPLEQFPPINRERGWYRLVCKPCTNQRVRGWYRSHPDWNKERARKQYGSRRSYLLSVEGRKRINGRVRARIAILREQVYEGYGNKCQCPDCPESDPRFLTVDHVNNDGHIERQGKKGSGGEPMYRRIVRDGFPPTFQLLCFNCNLGKARNGGVCPHLDKEGPSTIPNGSTLQAIGSGSTCPLN